MAKHFYPAIFTEEKEGYSVSFPDLEGCFSEGNTLDEACEMAKDAIGLFLEDQESKLFECPAPSNLKSIKCEENEHVVLIEFDEIKYKNKHSSKAVKKTLTIPQWLNDMAIKDGINFSGVLQNALMEQLHIER